MIKSLIKKINWVLSRIITQPKLTEGTISYDFWNLPPKQFQKQLNETLENYSKLNFSSDKLQDYAKNFIEDTRGNKYPFVKIYFNQEIARKIYEDESKDYFGWHEIKDFKTKSIEIKNGEIKEYETSINFRSNPDWKVEYAINRIPNDRKKIAGFMCTKYEITEIKQIKQNISKRYFKLYATNKIKLPGHLICGWHENVIPECPLEIVTNTSNKESRTFLKVREVSKVLPNSAFKIPKKFEK